MVAAFPDRELHVILDNLNTHKKCDRWLKKHPNVHFHFTPTRSSWLNQIETWFSILQGQSLNGASFTSVEELQEHIDAFISAYNETATPFAWTKKRVYQRTQPRLLSDNKLAQRNGLHSSAVTDRANKAITNKFKRRARSVMLLQIQVSAAGEVEASNTPTIRRLIPTPSPTFVNSSVGSTLVSSPNATDFFNSL